MLFENEPTIEALMHLIENVLVGRSRAGDLDEEEEEWLTDFQELVGRLGN